MRAFTLLALAGLTPFAFAAQPAHDSNAEQPPVEVYVYGMQLDVAHVIATTDVSRVCGVTSSRVKNIKGGDSDEETTGACGCGAFQFL